MTLPTVQCRVAAASSKGVIAGSAKQPKALFSGFGISGIAGFAWLGFGGENHDHLSCGWIWSLAAADADGEREDLDVFFESSFLRNKGKNASVTNAEKVFFVSLCDFVLKLFSGVFRVVTSGLIVEIEYGLANI